MFQVRAFAVGGAFLGILLLLILARRFTPPHRFQWNVRNVLHAAILVVGDLFFLGAPAMVTNISALEKGVWAASSLHTTNLTHLGFLLGVFLIPWRVGAIAALLIFGRVVTVYWASQSTWLLGTDVANDWLDFGCIKAYDPTDEHPSNYERHEGFPFYVILAGGVAMMANYGAERISRDWHLQVLHTHRLRTMMTQLVNQLLPFSVLSRIREESTNEGAAAGVGHFDESSLAFVLVAEEVEIESIREKLVRAADTGYEEFDKVVKRLGVERIGSVGETFYCGAGFLSASLPKAKGPQALIRAGLEFQALVKRMSKEQRLPPLSLRVGIHCDHTVGGVVDSQQQRYFLFGSRLVDIARGVCSAAAGCDGVLITAAVDAQMRQLAASPARDSSDMSASGSSRDASSLKGALRRMLSMRTSALDPKTPSRTGVSPQGGEGARPTPGEEERHWARPDLYQPRPPASDHIFRLTGSIARRETPPELSAAPPEPPLKVQASTLPNVEASTVSSANFPTPSRTGKMDVFRMASSRDLYTPSTRRESPWGGPGGAPIPGDFRTGSGGDFYTPSRSASAPVGATPADLLHLRLRSDTILYRHCCSSSRGAPLAKKSLRAKRENAL
ncbi:hypothetical protein T484DRAFT_1787075 [Baffinella frigidus]|nr:hypothetical protein T484DRAFT_1787075 [Cryptophyta sp. CCMP2293]